EAAALKDDKEFAAAMSGFAYHGYTLLSRKKPYPQQLRSIAETARGMGKNIWMTEWSIIAQKRTPLEHSFDVMQRLGRETSYIPTNYWTWWQGWYYKHPKGEVLLTGDDDNNLHISKTYRILQKLWHSAPPGSIVKRVETNDPEMSGYNPYAVQTVAFDHPRGMTVLLINTTAEAKHPSVRNLSGESATSYLTTDAVDMKAGPNRALHAGVLEVELPPRSITLLVTNRGSNSVRRR
ncbi:MAG TPA: hypothetical protein VF719_12495, partial [Abditibacteriaceae bacterium]